MRPQKGFERTRRRRVPTLLRSRSPCQQFPHAARCVALGLLNITRLESDLGAVDFAIDLVVAVDEADILGLGATFQRAGAAAQFEVFDEDDGVAVGQDGPVGVLDDARAVGGRSALPEFFSSLFPFMSAGRAFPEGGMRDDFGHRAFGALRWHWGHWVRVWSIEYRV